jgi:hypothetical protein
VCVCEGLSWATFMEVIDVVGSISCA